MNIYRREKFFEQTL